MVQVSTAQKVLRAIPSRKAGEIADKLWERDYARELAQSEAGEAYVKQAGLENHLNYDATADVIDLSVEMGEVIAVLTAGGTAAAAIAGRIPSNTTEPPSGTVIRAKDIDDGIRSGNLSRRQFLALSGSAAGYGTAKLMALISGGGFITASALTAMACGGDEGPKKPGPVAPSPDPTFFSGSVMSHMVPQGNEGFQMPSLDDVLVTYKDLDGAVIAQGNTNASGSYAFSTNDFQGVLPNARVEIGVNTPSGYLSMVRTTGQIVQGQNNAADWMVIPRISGLDMLVDPNTSPYDFLHRQPHGNGVKDVSMPYDFVVDSNTLELVSDRDQNPQQRMNITANAIGPIYTALTGNAFPGLTTQANVQTGEGVMVIRYVVGAASGSPVMSNLVQNGGLIRIPAISETGGTDRIEMAHAAFLYRDWDAASVPTITDPSGNGGKLSTMDRNVKWASEREGFGYRKQGPHESVQPLPE